MSANISIIALLLFFNSNAGKTRISCPADKHVREIHVYNDSLPPLHTIQEADMASVETSFKFGTITVIMNNGDSNIYRQRDWDYEDYYPSLNPKLREAIKSIKVTFTKAEHAPEFPGGEGAWEKYVQDFCHQHATQIQQAGAATVKLRFVVHIHGQITDLEILSGKEKTELNLLAIQCMQDSPAWICAKQNGFLVPCYQTTTVKIE